MDGEISLAEVSGPPVDVTNTIREKPFRPKPGKRFLKGPIPMGWLEQAASLPGKALHVGIWLWHWHFIKRSPKIGLSVKKLESFGVERHSAYRALKALEQAKLVSVDRHAGRSPLVTLRAIE